MKTGLRKAFEKPSQRQPKIKKRVRVAPISIRVCADERAALEKAAGDKSMNAYLRGLIFGKEAKPSAQFRGKSSKHDYEALGRVLAALGRSGIPDALDRLIAAQKRNAEMPNDAVLQQACADIAVMKTCLLQALGLKVERGAQQ